MKRWLPALVLVALLAGCTSAGTPPNGETVSPQPTESTSSSTSPTPASTENPGVPVPRFVGPADDGLTYAMTVGQTTTLRISDPDAPDPVASGEAVLLIAIINVTESGAREWEVRAVTAGTAAVRGAVGDEPWEITLNVTG